MSLNRTTSKGVYHIAEEWSIDDDGEPIPVKLLVVAIRDDAFYKGELFARPDKAGDEQI